MAGVDYQTQAQNQKALQVSVKNLAEVLGGIKVGGKDGLADVGVEATNRIKRLLSTPGRGRVYRRPPSVLHRASAPGDPPAPDTGLYRASWTWRLGEDARGPYVEIGTNQKRGPWFEFGTRRMAPRPHLRPTINSLRDEITKLVRDGVIREQTARVRRLPKEVRG